MTESYSNTTPSTFAERLWPAFSWFIFLLFTTILVLDRAVYALIVLVIVVIAFIAIFTYRPRWDIELRGLALVLLINLLLGLPNIVLAKAGLISLENPLRMLLMLPLILAVMRFGLRIRFICAGLAVGMLAAALVVAWQYHVLGVARPGIHYNPLLFSEIAMSAFAVLVAASLVIRGRWVILYVAGSFAALYGVILSGSRGTLIAIIPIIVFLLWWNWRHGAPRQLSSGCRAFLIPAILIILGVILISNGQFLRRIELGVKQTADYFESGDASTSVGLRLELWRSAWLAAREYPLLGIGGRSNRQAFIEDKIAKGELKPNVPMKRHAHNDYFNTLQNRGAPGLILQLLIYALPLLIFWRGLDQAKGDQLFAALGGMLMTISYMTFSLTEVPMYNGLPLIFFIITTSLLIGIVKNSQNGLNASNLD